MIKFGVLKSVLLSEAKAVSALSGSSYPVSDMRYVLDELKGLVDRSKGSNKAYTTYVAIRLNGTESAGTSGEVFGKCMGHNDLALKSFKVVAEGGQFRFRYLDTPDIIEW